MGPRRFAELFPHFAHQTRFNYTQQEEDIGVWLGTQAGNTYDINCSPGLGKWWAKQHKNSYVLSVSRGALHVLSNLGIFLSPGPLDHDNEFKEVYP